MPSRAVRSAAVLVLVLSLMVAAGPAAQVLCSTACPMKTAEASHCAGAKLAASCCCAKSATSLPATGSGLAAQIAASPQTPSTPGVVEAIRPSPLALAHEARARTPHERATPLVILYGTFLI